MMSRCAHILAAVAEHEAAMISQRTKAALAAKADVPTLFARMLDVLKRMHDRNASWGPLFIVHPGDIARHYFRTPRKAA